MSSVRRAYWNFITHGTAFAHTDSQCFLGPIVKNGNCALAHDKEEWERIRRLGTGALTGAVGGAAGIPLCTDPGACQTPVYMCPFVIYILNDLFIQFTFKAIQYTIS